jgi:hypothetical protein
MLSITNGPLWVSTMGVAATFTWLFFMSRADSPFNKLMFPDASSSA